MTIGNRKFFFTLVAMTVILAAPAFAADQPGKDTSPVSVAPWNWAGFYVGGTLGAARSKADVTLTTVNGSAALYDPLDVPGLNALGSPEASKTSAILGLRGGYNAQWGAVVAGVEGDISGLSTSKTTTIEGNPFLPSAPSFTQGSAVFGTETKSNWLVTLRPRVGYTFDRVLVYGTLGLAVGKVESSTAYVGFSPDGSGNEYATASASKTKVGLAAGLGCEYALTRNWQVSFDYLHVDLGKVEASGLVTTGNPSTATMNFSTKFKSDIAKLGVSYKF